MPPIVTLTTDFGVRDPYVASMKGVILSRCSDAQIVDLSHEITPQDVFEGALFIAEASRWFPEWTIHCVVVDPGVGTARLPIIARAQRQYFVCPDNGLLTFIVKEAPVDEVRIITNNQFILEPVSHTFHGRDMFAPAAACLARGVPMAHAGEKLNALTLLDVPGPRRDVANCVSGVVMHLDRFGNAITNIHRRDLPNRRDIHVHFAGGALESLSDTYGDVPPGSPVALFGSSDYLEIAVHRGSARDVYELRRGSRVDARF